MTCLVLSALPAAAKISGRLAAGQASSAEFSITISCTVIDAAALAPLTFESKIDHCDNHERRVEYRA